MLKKPPGSEGDSRDAGLIPQSGRSLREGSENPLQYSRLENPTDRRAWWVTVYGVTKSLDTTEHVPLGKPDPLSVSPGVGQASS